MDVMLSRRLGKCAAIGLIGLVIVVFVVHSYPSDPGPLPPHPDTTDWLTLNHDHHVFSLQYPGDIQVWWPQEFGPWPIEESSTYWFYRNYPEELGALQLRVFSPWFLRNPEISSESDPLTLLEEELIALNSGVEQLSLERVSVNGSPGLTIVVNDRFYFPNLGTITFDGRHRLLFLVVPEAESKPPGMLLFHWAADGGGSAIHSIVQTVRFGSNLPTSISPDSGLPGVSP